MASGPLIGELKRYLAPCVMTTLLRIHPHSAGAITPDDVESISKLVLVPSGCEWGECLPWCLRVIEKLHDHGMLLLTSSVEDLGKEFSEFAAGNRDYARRDKDPNLKHSSFCS
ncbi:hypothetical protein BT96DRAFT_271254 [Gymnopus androsaceus JB14]|uniref:Uncharacterized protein n=1 Tax=Gymnopus androsaceus JB14 TaxID=1447944 RepID=A0A6A4H328_9AGAR|nr:hypothetical protein BT96DRAFT_271254 [Gymnopus androsaceus JB14]